MADTKANIIITVSSIVLTLSLGRLNDPQMRISVLILASFTLIALLLAILAVLPKYRPLRLRNDELPSNFNILFFGHFAELSQERFLAEINTAVEGLRKVVKYFLEQGGSDSCWPAWSRAGGCWRAGVDRGSLRPAQSRLIVCMPATPSGQNSRCRLAFPAFKGDWACVH